MYLLPKLHKEKKDWLVPHQIPKGRPIISCTNAVMGGLAKFVDNQINNQVFRNKHLIKSTSALTRKLRELKCSNDYTFFGGDISELYLNFNTDILIEKFDKFLDDNGIIYGFCLSAILRKDLKNQIFSFGDNIYKQHNGIFMGSPYSPSLAGIYLLELDEFIMKQDYVVYYARYIDDIFIIIDNTKLKDDNEIENLKNANIDQLKKLNLKFGDIQHGKMITFLDLVLWIDSDNEKFEYCTYFKELHSFSYIQNSSWHSWPLKRGVIYSQFKRVHETNTNPIICKIFIELLMRKFMLCGYHIKTLRKIYNHTLFKLKLNDVNKINEINENEHENKEKVEGKDKNDKTKERIIYKHIQYHPKFDFINSKLNHLYKDNGITKEYNASFYNPKNTHALLLDFNPSYKERLSQGRVYGRRGRDIFTKIKTKSKITETRHDTQNTIPPNNSPKT